VGTSHQQRNRFGYYRLMILLRLSVRADTLAAPNTALITAQSRIGPTQRWSGGLLASIDETMPSTGFA